MPGEGLTHGPPGSKKPGGSHHRFSRIIRHSLRDGFNGILRALPGEPGFLAPIAARFVSAKLDTSVGVPGPHDFAVRIGIARLARPTRPSHPRLTFGDDWPKRPLHRGGMTQDNHTLPKNGRIIFFAGGLDTDSHLESAPLFRLFAHAMFGRERLQDRSGGGQQRIDSPAGHSRPKQREPEHKPGYRLEISACLKSCSSAAIGAQRTSSAG
jgi:hypothetical protein